MSSAKVDNDNNPLIEKKPEEEEEELEFLDRQQVNACRNMIEDIHPIKQFHITKVMPWSKIFSCCIKKEKKDFRHGLKRTLLEKMGMEITQTDQDMHSDPLMILGFGLNSYLEITWLLMCKFLVIMIFFLPIVAIYTSYGALEDYDYYTYSQYSLGNIGGSTSQCQIFPVEVSTVTLDCPVNTVFNSTAWFQDSSNEDNYIGLIASDASDFSFCSVDAMTADSENAGTDCSSYVELASMIHALQDCDGQNSCDVDLANLVYTSDAPQNCQSTSDSTALMFIQMPCIHTNTELEKVQVLGLVISCIAVFVALFTMVFNDYIKVTQTWGELDFDVKTVTASDYSVEFDIKEEQFLNWKTAFYETNDPKYGKGSNKSPAVCFKYWLEDHFNKVLHDLPHMHYDDEPGYIADITLAYRNAEVIRVLKERGQAIKHEKYDEMREFDKQLNHMKDTYEEYHQIANPCSVFMTMESEEGYQRMVNFNELITKDKSLENKYKDFHGDEIEVQPAAEPADIIWENRMYDTRYRSKKKCEAALVISITLIISLTLIVAVSMGGNVMKFMYGVNPDCTTIASNFGYVLENTDGEASSDLLQQQAYTDIQAGSLNDGTIQCFCDDQVNELGTSYSYEYDVYGDGSVSYAICSDWYINYYIGYAITESVSFIIIAINGILNSVTVTMVQKIGHETKSEQMTDITNYVFYALFINTGFVILLAYSNLSEISPNVLGKVFDESYNYYDYQKGWYINVGYLLTYTMLINMVMAPLMAVIGRVQQGLFRKMDRSWGSDVYTTKQTSMQLYVDLYSGPEYIVHSKYSAVLNVVFVTMLYGVGLPLLFPIAFVTLFFIYVTEKVELAYNYRLPATFDDTLTKNCVQLLRFTPIIFVMNGYWMLSNKQYFDNVVTPVDYISDVMLSGHYIKDIFSVNQASPLLLMTIMTIVVAVLELYFPLSLQRWGMSMTSVQLEVDEDLPNFFTALKLRDCDYMVNEHHYYRDNYGIEILSHHVCDKLDDSKMPSRPIQGNPFYNIIANDYYMRDMYYIDNSQPCREAQIKDDDSDEENDTEQSDLVVLMLNIGFIPEEVAMMKWETGFNKSFKKRMHELGLIDDAHYGHKTRIGHDVIKHPKAGHHHHHNKDTKIN